MSRARGGSRQPSLMRILMLLVLFGMGVHKLINGVDDKQTASVISTIVWCVLVLYYFTNETKAYWKKHKGLEDEDFPPASSRCDCPYCGADNPSGHEFCNCCGRRLR